MPTQVRMNCLKTENKSIDGQCVRVIMSTPLGGGHIIFAFSGVRRPDAWFPLI